MFLPLRPILCAAACLSVATVHAAHQMEFLDRGLIAMRLDDGRVMLGWRLLGTDPPETTFHVYRSIDGGAAERITDFPLIGPTSYIDPTADSSHTISYRVRAVAGGRADETSEAATIPAGSAPFEYLRIPLDPPAAVSDPLVGDYTYTAGDASAADLDGDGRYEIILKWDPSNAKDNSQSGYTGSVLIDAYQLDGSRLWRLDLGPNIRAGAHYTQFIAYDFDGDGRAELACRTAPGALDGLGQAIGDPVRWQDAGGPARPSFSPTDDYRTGGGYILSGPEFLTFFDGETGAELVSTNFVPLRDPDNSNASPSTSRIQQVWGDNYGNRIDRFLAGAAYLDGTRPSLVMTRGYYTRTFLVAWDWREGNLTRRWVFDSNVSGNSAYAGQGAHSLTVGDVDDDGRDEIVFGACTIDDDGSGLYSTGLAHGDALHLSDMDPTRPGMEVWMVHESPSSYGENGSELHDAATGEIIFGVAASDDIGRGIAADIDPRTPGFEAWSSRANLHDMQGSEIASTRPGSMNFLCWWDGDLLRELLNGTTIAKWDWENSATANLLSPTGISSNNGSKATPALSADLFGDWREEIIWRESDNSALRVYSTIHPTPHRLPTLMHDRQYRLAIAWQNVGYNQPPHPGYYLAEGMGAAPVPEITVIPPAGSPTPTASRFATWLTDRGLSADSPPDLDHDSNGPTLFEEYAFGLTEGHRLEVAPQPAGPLVTLPAVRTELDYTLESSPDLASWTPLGTFPGGEPLEFAPATGPAQEFFRLTTSTTFPQVYEVTTTSQAEDVDFEGFLESNHSGFGGTGFINFDTTGSFIEWTGIDGGVGGPATLSFRFALGATGPRTGVLRVNGIARDITFPPTGAWNSWSTMDVVVSLAQAATNTIRLESNGNDLANIDALDVTARFLATDGPVVRVATTEITPYETARIFIIGDSTVANYSASAYPMRGWGQVMQHFVDPARITIHNRAIGGRSSKSFIVEGRWDTLKTELQSGDYLLIQWGHNDRDWTKPERYTTETEFRTYLAQYIAEARALDVTPVFVTPMVMNAWNGSTMRNVFTESSNNYAGWMKEVAATLDVPVIDLNLKSFDFFRVRTAGSNSRFFYNTYPAGEYPNYPTGNSDGTHFQEMGALMMAKFVAAGFRELAGDPRVGDLENGLKPQYPIVTRANSTVAGQVTPTTEMPEGVTFTLKALANTGHNFINWKDSDGGIFTTDSLSTFTVNPAGGRFTAYFTNESPVAPPPAGSVIPGGDPFDFKVRLTAAPSGTEASVTFVEFRDEDSGDIIGTDDTAPFEAVWEIDAGSHRVTAEATDALGTRTRSTVLSFHTGS